MLSFLDLSGRTPSSAELRRILPRGGANIASALPQVEPIVAAVRERGLAAALELGERFDHARPETVRVPQQIIDTAVAELAGETRAALLAAIERIRAVHADQVPEPHSTAFGPDARVTEVFRPVERVGLYVPGGNAVYPSSVLMNAIPAQEAGVEGLVVASPPQADCGGWPHPTVLAACGLLGVDEVWAIGGAQAVALLAYGDESAELEPVDMVTGPGNIFVTAAKRLVRGVVGTDAEAGPTEIAVLADASADPELIAADLISQAEHDMMAASVLITDSRDLAHAVDAEIEKRVPTTRNAERVREALMGEQSGVVVVDDLEAGIQTADAYAAEHLEVHTANAHEVARRVRHAGAVFVGPYSPVPLGDYAAGSNHVLPTSGTARFGAGLSSHTFLRPVNLIEYGRDGLGEVAGTIEKLAHVEGLPAHGEAIRARFAGSSDAAEEAGDNA